MIYDLTEFFRGPAGNFYGPAPGRGPEVEEYWCKGIALRMRLKGSLRDARFIVAERRGRKNESQTQLARLRPNKESQCVLGYANSLHKMSLSLAKLRACMDPQSTLLVE